MKIPRYQLAEVLAERTLTNFNAKTFSEEVAGYLLFERRTSDLDSLIRDIMEYRIRHGIVEVRAVCARPLTESLTRDITKEIRRLFPDAKQVIISPVLDPLVVGGVRLELPNEQLDLSVRAKLSRFKQLTSSGRN
jgi:F0F1-type ATP synthase delta subunit